MKQEHETLTTKVSSKIESCNIMLYQPFFKKNFPFQSTTYDLRLF